MEKIPKEIENLTTDLEDMMETARSVQGEVFTNLVSYVMNNHNLMQLLAGAVEQSIKEQKNIFRNPEEPVSEMMLNMLSHNTNAYAEALNLSEEKIDEAMKFIDAMSTKIYNTRVKMRSSE
jgi:chemotaxis protein histidine kinase CheA